MSKKKNRKRPNSKKSKSALKVYFLTTSNSGTAFWRMHQFKEAMNRLGLASAVIPWYNFDNQYAQEWQWHVHDDPRVYARTGVINSMVREADVVVVQYLHTFEALALVEALKACHPDKVFLTEIDDNILETPTYNEAHDQYSPSSKYRDVVVEQMKALDGIVVSTPYLAKLYKEFNKHVYVVPNAVDFGAWKNLAVPAHPGEVRIGWAGALNHYEDLSTIEAPLKEYLAKNKGVSFHLLFGGDDRFKDQSKIVWHKRWTKINKYQRTLAGLGFDIGIAPLVDNGFNRAKSNLRKLEYGALGIPVLASNVGHFKETVKHGKDGFLFNDPKEFVEHLDRLVKDEKLRKLMGRYNHLDVKTRFNLDVVAAHYVDVLKEAKARGQTTTVDVSEAGTAQRRSQWIVGQPALS